MFVAKNFVYLELHKTACTHIGQWISRFVEGEQIGKHNVLPEHLQDRFILGSVRNPWDWYVSLWGYGCDKRGSVWKQVLDGVSLDYCRKQLPREMGRLRVSPAIFARQCYSDFRKDSGPWEFAYQDSADPQCFKAWLKLMFDENRRFDFREGYGFSPLSRSSGILCYRFLKFFTKLGSSLYSNNSLGEVKQLTELWGKYKYSGYLIRMEELEEDLIKGLELAGISLADEQKQDLIDAKNNKTNTSSRLSSAHYHDDETIELIAQREKLIIDLFDYKPPI